MPAEVPITIRQADLGPPQPDIALTRQDLWLFDGDGEIRVNVLVDGEPIKPTRRGDSIAFKAPLDPDDDVVTVVLTTKDGEMLKVLQYDKKGNPIVDSDARDEEELIRGLGKTIRKAADTSDVKGAH